MLFDGSYLNITPISFEPPTFVMPYKKLLDPIFNESKGEPPLLDPLKSKILVYESAYTQKGPNKTNMVKKIILNIDLFLIDIIIS